MTGSAALPDPIELGFHEKFQRWYPDQITAIDKVILGTSRFTALAMPTGSGKSVTGIAAALLHPEVTRALYLTANKGLQDQLAPDFGGLGLFDIRGQRNYPCTAVGPKGHLFGYFRGRRQVGCDEGPCHAGVHCSDAPSRAEPYNRPSCPYYGAVHDARKATLVSTNYAMWLNASVYGQGFGKFDLLILDEAHDADKELEAFLTLEVTKDDAKHISTKLPASRDLAVWRDWGRFHHQLLRSKIEVREQFPPTDADGLRDIRQLKAILSKLARLGEIDPLTWILDLNPVRGKLAPTRVASYAEEYLFQGTKHVLLMSATMTRKTTQLLGIPSSDLNFWECPSTFPVEHRPIININTYPAVRVNARMHEDDKYMWLRRIDQLIEPRVELNRKGIIHTVSYQRMKELLAGSEHKHWMMVHDAANTRETIQQFKKRDGPWILVSPSIVTGYDFPNDECRYQILAKVPIPDMRGAIMSARGQLDPEYSGYLAMQKFVQACGRIVRGPNDWGETFCVDDTFSDWFLNKYRRHAPRWFMDALEYTDVFPKPLMIDL